MRWKIPTIKSIKNFEIMMRFHANDAEKFAARHWLPRQIVATDEEC